MVEIFKALNIILKILAQKWQKYPIRSRQYRLFEHIKLQTCFMNQKLYLHNILNAHMLPWMHDEYFSIVNRIKYNLVRLEKECISQENWNLLI